MKANEFVKKYGWEKSKSILINAHPKATHFYCGWMGLVDYFYNHENLGWCQVDIRTKGWDSDRCTRGIHPPVNAMVSVDDLKSLVKSYNLVEHYGGLEDAKDEYFSCVQNHEPATHIARAVEDVESCL